MGGVTKATKEFAACPQNGFHNADIAALVQNQALKKESSKRFMSVSL